MAYSYERTFTAAAPVTAFDTVVELYLMEVLQKFKKEMPANLTESASFVREPNKVILVLKGQSQGLPVEGAVTATIAYKGGAFLGLRYVFSVGAEQEDFGSRQVGDHASLKGSESFTSAFTKLLTSIKNYGLNK